MKIYISNDNFNMDDITIDNIMYAFIKNDILLSNIKDGQRRF